LCPCKPTGQGGSHGRLQGQVVCWHDDSACEKTGGNIQKVRGIN
jgi:hypothetical protein